MDYVVVMTKYMQEFEFCDDLRGLMGEGEGCCDIVLPTEPRCVKISRRSRSGSSVVCFTPLFPGYVFVGGMRDWRQLFSVRGCDCVLMNSGVAVSVPGSVVWRFRDGVRDAAVEHEMHRSRVKHRKSQREAVKIKAPSVVNLKSGQDVRIVSGLFADLLGIYEGDGVVAVDACGSVKRIKIGESMLSPI